MLSVSADVAMPVKRMRLRNSGFSERALTAGSSTNAIDAITAKNNAEDR